MDLFGEDESKEQKEDTIIGVADPQAPDFSQALQEDTETLRPPRENLLCLGHETCEQHILDLYNNKRMPHGLVLSGPEGIGKSTFAFRLARFLLSRREADPGQESLFGGGEENVQAQTMTLGENHAHIIARVASAGHSDLLTIERLMDERKGTQKDGVEVSEVRRVAPFLRKTAAEADWRVVIIDDADTMNINAQNALLKILEEPPERVVLILITHRIGALIPTIRSRTQAFHFAPLDKVVMKELLAKQGHAPNNDEFEALYELSEGSIGRALSLLDDGGLDVMSKILMMFEQYPQWKPAQIHTLSEDIARGTQAQSYKVFESILLWVAAALVKSKARHVALPAGPLSKEVFEALKNKMSLEELVKICDNLTEHFETVRRANLDKRQSVLQAFSYFGA